MVEGAFVRYLALKFWFFGSIVGLENWEVGIPVNIEFNERLHALADNWGTYSPIYILQPHPVFVIGCNYFAEVVF